MALVNNRGQVPVVITAGGTLSSEGDIGPLHLVGIASDANWTPQTIGIYASYDGVNFLPCQGPATAMPYGTLQASSIMVIDPGPLRFLAAIKIVSGSAAAPATQSNTTTLTLLTGTID